MDVFGTLRDYLTEHFGWDPEKVTMEASFTDDLGADSLDLVELVMQIEERFDITVEEKDAENLHTVGDVIAFLKARGVS